MPTATIDYAAPKLDAEMIPLLVLKEGAHKSRADGLCIMEAAAFVAGLPHSDNPRCVSPVIGSYCRRTNDRLGQDYRDGLRDRVLKIVGSRSTPVIDRKRLDELLSRTFTRIVPLAFDAAASVKGNAAFRDRLAAHAAELRALTRKEGIHLWRAAAQRARATALEARAAAAAAYAAADAKKIGRLLEIESLATLDAMLEIV